MKKWMIGVVILLALSASSVAADEPPTIPKAPPPQFLTAQVTGKDHEQVTFTRYYRVSGKDGKDQFKTVSESSLPKQIGKDVQAFGVDGKPIESAALAKLLAKPNPVVVYYANLASPVTLDLFYLRLLKEGTVVLVIACYPWDPIAVPGAAQPNPATPTPATPPKM